MRLLSSAASLSRLLAGQHLPKATEQLRQVTTSTTTLQQEAANVSNEPSISPNFKDMNYCTAVNDALYKIMATDSK